MYCGVLTARTMEDLVMTQTALNFTNIQYVIPHIRGVFPAIFNRMMSERPDLYNTTLEALKTRRAAVLFFPSLMDTSVIIESIWKGKIDHVRYKGLAKELTSPKSKPDMPNLPLSLPSNHSS
ncbi:hypothetical protein D9758_003473 [Tetrapyrgos nigripes]|uniref:Uncharacterized protein n=1 Tax=Tetrapyrgos nigripes TaxID=182062 RepID=A0A8H5GVB6_9AGAR|nr:hypothetical protein D9758_003473 [Tetrapyrgos nigripes]